MDELLKLAEKALALYVAASIDPKSKKLADQRKNDLTFIDKIITERRANENPHE